MFNHALIALYYAYLLFIRTTAEECSESVNTPDKSHKKSVSEIRFRLLTKSWQRCRDFDLIR
ncbi:hypothetical protein, partial [Morganella morganii]|uniref:hypothetical protein n=1 Tax=Morganella morganii TaxID=582 RepID=UPI001D1384F3